jgi:hypothetical protein
VLVRGVRKRPIEAQPRSRSLYLHTHYGNALFGMAALLELHAVSILVEEHMASSLANPQR